MKKMKSDSTKPIPVRLTEREIEKLDLLVDHYQNLAPGKVTRADVIRFAIDELYRKNIKGE